MVILIFVVIASGCIQITNTQSGSGSQGSTGGGTTTGGDGSGSTGQFPLSQATGLAVEIQKSKGNINTITYNGYTLNQYQCIYITAKAILMINSGQQGSIPIKSFQAPSNPQGTVTSATITKSQYLDMASRLVSFMDQELLMPNYIGINTPGQADLSPTSILNLFSKVLVAYQNTGQLPASVSIP